MILEQVTWNWNQNLNPVFKNWTQGSIFVFWARTTHQGYSPVLGGSHFFV
jgi:hypothetical protein